MALAAMRALPVRTQLSGGKWKQYAPVAHAATGTFPPQYRKVDARDSGDVSALKNGDARGNRGVATPTA